MTDSTEIPKVDANGLVTLAFLKAQLDGGSDTLSIFMPLLKDVIHRINVKYFSTLDVQLELEKTHGVLMPQETIHTLLMRINQQGLLLREGGRFSKSDIKSCPEAHLEEHKQEAAQSQMHLAAALRQHAHKLSLSIDTDDAALSLLLKYLQSSQVSLLLGLPKENISAERFVSTRETEVVSHFISSTVNYDTGLRDTLQKLLQGWVLYNAAFRPYSSDDKSISFELHAYLDSPLVLRALGYEGELPMRLVLESIGLLSRVGVSCRVFEKTIYEIKGLLVMYQSKLKSISGRQSLRQTSMTRYFLSKRLSPSDIQELISLLESNVEKLGLSIEKTPKREPEYNLDERSLAKRLADPNANDIFEPRVDHDVNCIAAICTLRKGTRPIRIEQSQCIFVATSPRVIRNVRRWWNEDESRADIPPIIHISEIANIAWLRDPCSKSDLHIQELVALCEAALRPSEKTWRRFIGHLRKLQIQNSLSSEEVDIIVSSSLTEQCLKDIGLNDDLDATTMDEVVERVRHEYIAEYEAKLRKQKDSYEETIGSLQFELRRKEHASRKFASTASRWISTAILIPLFILVLYATIKGIQFSITFGLAGILTAFAAILVTVAGLVGTLKEIRGWMSTVEQKIALQINRHLL